METLNSWATAIGWIVMLGVVLHFLTKVGEGKSRKVQEKALADYDVTIMAGRIALRRIYNENEDVEIRGAVKSFAMQVPGMRGWASLELEKSDSEFRVKCERLGEIDEYSSALKLIQQSGEPLKLEGKRIKPLW